MTISPVHREIVVQASLQRAFEVFAAFAWWPQDHSILPEAEGREKIVAEPRAEGRWFELGKSGTTCAWGKVLAWDPPHRMLLAWQLNGNFEYDTSAQTEVEVTFVPEGQATRVILEHRGFENYRETGQALRDAVGSDNGWNGVLTAFGAAVNLAERAASPDPVQAQPAARYFVCKLIIPRPQTFMQDMSDAEGEALGNHITYWSKLADRNEAVVFGPVGDPAGVWGLGVISAVDEMAARKIAEDDPAIKSGLGFKCDVYPMLRAVLGKAVKSEL